MDITQLQKQWQECGRATAARPQLRPHATLTAHVARRYAALAIIILLMPLLTPVMRQSLGLAWWSVVVFAGACACIGLCALIMWRRVSDRRFTALPTTEAAGHLRATLRLMHLCNTISRIAALTAAVAITADVMRPNYIVLAAFGGAIIGAVAGHITDVRTRRDIENLYQMINPDDDGQDN